MMKVLLSLLPRVFTVSTVKNSRQRKTFTNIWYKIWLEEKYAAATDSIIEKYSVYNPFSIDLLVKFMGIFSVGTVRIIKSNNEVSLPVLNDFEVKQVWNGKELIEITLFTIKRRFRGSGSLPALMLMRAVYRYARKERLEGMVIAADERLFYLLKRSFGLPFRQIGKEKFYEGSLTYPAYLDIKEAEVLVKKRDQTLYRFFIS